MSRTLYDGEKRIATLQNNTKLDFAFFFFQELEHKMLGSIFELNHCFVFTFYKHKARDIDFQKNMQNLGITNDIIKQKLSKKFLKQGISL